MENAFMPEKIPDYAGAEENYRDTLELAEKEFTDLDIIECGSASGSLIDLSIGAVRASTKFWGERRPADVTMLLVDIRDQIQERKMARIAYEQTAHRIAEEIEAKGLTPQTMGLHLASLQSYNCETRRALILLAHSIADFIPDDRIELPSGADLSKDAQQPKRIFLIVNADVQKNAQLREEVSQTIRTLELPLRWERTWRSGLSSQPGLRP